MNLQTLLSIGALSFVGMTMTVSKTETETPTPTAAISPVETEKAVQSIQRLSQTSEEWKARELPDLMVAAPAKASGDCPCGPECTCSPSCVCRVPKTAQVEECPPPTGNYPPVKSAASVPSIVAVQTPSTKVVVAQPKTIFKKVCNGRTCQMVEVVNPNYQPVVGNPSPNYPPVQSATSKIGPKTSVTKPSVSYPAPQQMQPRNQYYQPVRPFRQLFRWR